MSSSYDCTVRLWNLNLSHKVPNISKIPTFQKFLHPVLTIATDDHTRVAIGCYDGSIKVWNVNSNRIVSQNKAHEDSVSWLSVRSGMLASCSADCSMKIWDFNTMQRVATISFGEILNVVCWSYDCKILVSAGWEKVLYVYSITEQRIISELSGHSGDITCLYHFQNQDLLASASTDNSVRLWDLTGRKLEHIYKGHNSRITSISVDEEGDLIASGSWDKSVKLWDVRRRRLSQSFDHHDYAVSSVKFSASGKYCVSQTEYKAYVWKIQKKLTYSLSMKV